MVGSAKLQELIDTNTSVAKKKLVQGTEIISGKAALTLLLNTNKPVYFFLCLYSPDVFWQQIDRDTLVSTWELAEFLDNKGFVLFAADHDETAEEAEEGHF